MNRKNGMTYAPTYESKPVVKAGNSSLPLLP